MPGKAALPVSANKSKERTGSATSDSKKRRDQDVQKISIWPEWTESELAAEKWEMAGGKGKDKKTPLPGSLYDDPDGHVLLPGSLQVDSWKRPSEYLMDQTPSIVMSEDTFDLVSTNEHLYTSETMLWIISQIMALWNVRVQLSAGLNQMVAPTGSGNPSSMSGSETADGLMGQCWRPWDHIFPQPKGQATPSYNPAGKYCVRLYWMGHWRKVTIDDHLPFDAQGRLLLPSTTNPCELWPAILSKAILKIMSLDYTAGCEWSEFGEASPVHMLTGWLPHTIAVKRDSVELWDKLSGWLPLWKRPPEKPPDSSTPSIPLHNKHLDSTLAAEGKSPRNVEGKQRHKGSALHLSVPPGGAVLQPVMSTELTRALVLASFAQPPTWYPIQQSVKQELAIASELLTENGLPPHHPHAVLLTQVRDEPLQLPPKEPPPPVIQTPHYLGLRHRSKLPTDPPSPSPRPREPKWIKLNTPLLAKPPPPPPVAVPEKSDETSITDGSHGSIVAPPVLPTEPDHTSWISFEDFICTFSVLHVFYNPVTFSQKEMCQDLRNTTANSAVPVSLSGKKGAAASSIVMSSSKILSGPHTMTPVVLFDSSETVDVTISFSALCNWVDGQKISRTRKLPMLGIVPPVQSGDEQPSEGTTTASPVQKCREVLPAGVLVVEPYCWKDVVLKPPLLSITTTAAQTAVLSLPPGKHIFRLQIMAPIGYHLELFSDHYFILTNEDNVFVHMNEESKLMLAHGSDIVSNLLEIATTCDGTTDHTPSMNDQVTELAKVKLDDHHIKYHLYKVLCCSVHYSLSSTQQQLQLTNAMLFAWRAFLHLIMHVLVGGAQRCRLDVDMTSLPAIERKGAPLPDNWKDREPTEEELSAANKIQKAVDKHLDQQITKCLQTGSPQHTWMIEELTKSVELIAPHSELLGKLMFSTMFQLDQSLFQHFPFYENEQNRAYHQDYTGSYNELPLNQWTLLFRETFFVQEPGIMMFPRLTLIPKTCLLRVIDNDTGVEVPQLFHKVIPHHYKPNKAGYTILGEVWSRDDTLEGGDWQLRLVGSTPHLPTRKNTTPVAPTGDELPAAITITPSLHTHEVIDYYLPDKDKKFLRYILKVKKDEACPVTVQLRTSKSDAFFKLEILDKEETVCCVKGKGHAVLPVCWLQPDDPPISEEDGEASKRENDVKTHKYVIQATITRDSWPAGESAWSYMTTLKQIEKMDDIHASGDKPPSARKQPSKPAKGTKMRERAGSVLQHRQQIDVSKPHWVLRVVMASSDIMLCVKDTEKEDELKAMVTAWETEQPGRTKKALESRRKYLSACKQPIVTGETDNADCDATAVVSDADGAVNVTVPTLPDGPAMIKRVDYTQYMINTGIMPRLLQPEEWEHRQSQWQQRLAEYRQQRQVVIQRREEDLQMRNTMKKQQVELAEQWQVELEQARQKMNEARNAIRDRFLAQQQKLKEEQALLAAQTSVDTAGGRDSKAKGKAAKGKKK